MSAVEQAEALVSPMKVNELKENLKKRGLSTAGNKAALADRLKSAIVEEKSDDGEGVTTEENPAPVEEDQNAGKDEPSEVEQEEEQTPQENDSAVETTEESKPAADIPEEQKEVDQTQEEQSNETTEEEKSVEEPAAMEEDTPQQKEEEVEGSKMETDTGVGPEETEAMDQTEEDKQPEAETTEQPRDETVSDKTEDEETTEKTTEVPVEEPADSSTTEVNAEKKTETQDEGGPEEKKEEEMDESKGRQDVRRERKRHSDDTGSSFEEKEEERKKNREEAIDPDDPTETPEMAPDSFQSPPEDEHVIILDRYNSDLHFDISADGLGGCGRTDGGFVFLWAGARAIWGVKGGKYAYECRIEEKLEVDMSKLDIEEEQAHPHACRVGFSRDGSDLIVGEDTQSYGYGSTSKAITNRSIVDYGEAYEPGDVIGCFIDFEGELKSISFSRNGSAFGSAFVLSDESITERGLFPHVSTKNMRVTLNFGSEPFAFDPPEGFTPIQKAEKEHLVRAAEGPSSKEECEVILMVGLPSAGKTSWVQKQMRKNREKRYTVLGTNYILNKMRVSGVKRRDNFKERWSKLYKMANEVLNQLFVLASRHSRNYIIDQSNLYHTARVRKMGFFEGFKKKACVCVVSAEERRRREKRRDDGVPEVSLDDLKTMQSNYTVPKEGELFEEILFGELGPPDAERIVEAGHRWARGEARKRPPFQGGSAPAYKRFRGGSPGDMWGSRGGGRGYYNYPPRGGYSPYGGSSPFGGYGGPPRGGGGYGGYSPYGNYGNYGNYGSPYGQYGGQRGWRGGRGGRGGGRGGRR